jgi:hypothetical protein
VNWGDERFVKLYTRDTPDWLALSFDAQALFVLLMRKVDRSGVLQLGKHGKRAVALAIGHASHWERVEPALDELVADGCVVMHPEMLVIRNFIEAQEVPASNRRRQAEFRARRRDAVTSDNDESQRVTQRNAESHDVTPSNAASHGVTTRLDKTRLDKNNLEHGSAQASLISSNPEPRFDFEALYARYPRKRGKAAGLKLCHKHIRSEADYGQLARAVDTYARECMGKDPQYVMHFSKFMGGCWRDYVQPESPTVSTPGPARAQLYKPPVVASPVAPDAVRDMAKDLLAKMRGGGQ